MASPKLTLSDTQLRAKFFTLQSRQDIADLLEISDYQLRYHLYILPSQQRYKSFQIPKKSGGTRQITAPESSLKIIQRKLNQVLQAVYRPKQCNHGFVRQKNILTNAREHVRRRFVLNIDLQDFFPSINFGRVRGMFMAPPYKLNAQAATVLAQICCFNNELPQGSPASPVVSNMICAKMDDQLRALARKYKCLYSRYADDITFSTYLTKFPETLAKYSESTGILELGMGLEDLINKNGFKINNNKSRLQTGARRQQVTGLTVNRIVNVRREYINQIRAMLHAWEKYGLEAAENEFIQKYDKKAKLPIKRKISFRNIVKGKIEFVGMIRGKDSFIFIKFYDQFCELDPLFTKQQHIQPQHVKLVKPRIITEGKTDWKHLEASLVKLKNHGFLQDMDLEFYRLDDQRGGDNIKNMCRQYSRSLQNQPTIFIFDNDDPQVTKDVSEEGREYKTWDNNVFSLVIPVPGHRAKTPEVCIELYYKDEEIVRKDPQNRRLFLSNEFFPKSGKHKTEDDLNCTDLNKIKNPERLCVIDDRVFRVFKNNEENIALPKNDFADSVLAQAPNFNDFDHSEFNKIFEIIAGSSQKTTHSHSTRTLRTISADR